MAASEAADGAAFDAVWSSKPEWFPMKSIKEGFEPVEFTCNFPNWKDPEDEAHKGVSIAALSPEEQKKTLALNRQARGHLFV